LENGAVSERQNWRVLPRFPNNRESGKGTEHTLGGRANVRRAGYLPAVVATCFNLDLKANYEQLVATGMCKKLATIAVMRKPIIMENALLCDGRKWNEYPD
jgi:transposase